MNTEVMFSSKSEKRLIDANALIEEANAEGAYGYVDAFQIANAPTVDAVEVVRCRDCKHWHKETLFCDYMPYGEAQERVNWYADDFCSYGERKDNE